MSSSIARTSKALRQGLALPLEQTVACLSTLELVLHEAQRLSGREHRISILESNSCLAWPPARLLHGDGCIPLRLTS